MVPDVFGAYIEKLRKQRISKSSQSLISKQKQRYVVTTTRHHVRRQARSSQRKTKANANGGGANAVGGDGGANAAAAAGGTEPHPQPLRVRCRKWFLLFEDFLRTLRRLRWLDAVDAILLTEVDPDPSLRDNVQLVLSSRPVSDVFERFGNMFHANFTTEELAELRTRRTPRARGGDAVVTASGGARSTNTRVRTSARAPGFRGSVEAAHGGSGAADDDDADQSTASCSTLPSLMSSSRVRVSTRGSRTLNAKSTDRRGDNAPISSAGVATRKRRSRHVLSDDHDHRRTNHPRTKRSRLSQRRRLNSHPRGARTTPHQSALGALLGLICVNPNVDVCSGSSGGSSGGSGSGIEDAADYGVFENIERHRRRRHASPSQRKAAARREVDSFCSRVLDYLLPLDYNFSTEVRDFAYNEILRRVLPFLSPTLFDLYRVASQRTDDALSRRLSRIRDTVTLGDLGVDAKFRPTPPSSFDATSSYPPVAVAVAAADEAPARAPTPLPPERAPQLQAPPPPLSQVPVAIAAKSAILLSKRSHQKPSSLVQSRIEIFENYAGAPQRTPKSQVLRTTSRILPSDTRISNPAGVLTHESPVSADNANIATNAPMPPSPPHPMDLSQHEDQAGLYLGGSSGLLDARHSRTPPHPPSPANKLEQGSAGSFSSHASIPERSADLTRTSTTQVFSKSPQHSSSLFSSPSTSSGSPQSNASLASRASSQPGSPRSNSSLVSRTSTSSVAYSTAAVASAPSKGVPPNPTPSSSSTSGAALTYFPNGFSSASGRDRRLMLDSELEAVGTVALAVGSSLTFANHYNQHRRRQSVRSSSLSFDESSHSFFSSDAPSLGRLSASLAIPTAPSPPTFVAAPAAPPLSPLVESPLRPALASAFSMAPPSKVLSPLAESPLRPAPAIARAAPETSHVVSSGHILLSPQYPSNNLSTHAKHSGTIPTKSRPAPIPTGSSHPTDSHAHHIRPAAAATHRPRAESAALDQARSYARAIDHFRLIGRRAVPVDKVRVVVDASALFSKCVDEIYAAAASNGGKGGGEGGGAAQRKRYCIDAENMLSLIVFSLIHARVPHLVAELEFIEDFLTDSLKLNEEGYYLVALRAAVEYVQNVELFSRTAKKSS